MNERTKRRAAPTAVHWSEGVRNVNLRWTPPSGIEGVAPFDVCLAAEDGQFAVVGAVCDDSQHIQWSSKHADITMLEPHAILLEIDGKRISGMIKDDVRRMMLEALDDGNIDLKFIRPGERLISVCYFLF